MSLLETSSSTKHCLLHVVTNYYMYVPPLILATLSNCPLSLLMLEGEPRKSLDYLISKCFFAGMELGIANMCTDYGSARGKCDVFNCVARKNIFWSC